MTADERRVVRVTIVAADPPFGDSDPVLFGLQAKDEVDDPRPASATTTFECEIGLVADGAGGHDFRGDLVHGRKGDRFLYLSWGLPDPGQPFVMFARAKIKLTLVPPDVLSRAMAGAAIVCELDATNPKGQPASGTIKEPYLRWSARE